MSATRILLVADAAFEDRVRAALPELNGNLLRWTGEPGELYVQRRFDELMASSPEVIAFGPGLPPESAFELASDLDRLHPEVEVLVVAQLSPLLWERAARAGVRELVSPTSTESELGDALRRAQSTVDARRRQQPTGATESPAETKVIVVRSPKGGSGKTMVASNVAVSLARLHPGEVVLVDLDLPFGDMASALGIEPTYTIADATANVDLTPTALKALLSTHRSSLYALCAPADPTESVVITPDDVTAVLSLLRSAFQFVVIDTAAGSDDWASAAIAQATDLVLVCSMDVSSVRALRKEIVSVQDVAGPHRHVVLNRANSRVGLDVRDIEATIGTPVDVQVSSSRSVPLHMNCGKPVTEAEPSSTVSKQLRELVSRLEPARVAPARAWRKRR